MDRVEQVWKAQEAAYNEMMKDDDQYCHPESFRWGFEQGVEWTEKDLALTWEDIAEIDALILDTNNEFAVDYSKEINRQQFYEEVLRKFNKSKKDEA